MTNNKRSVLNRAIKTVVETFIASVIPLWQLLDWSDTENLTMNILYIVLIPAIATTISVLWNKYENMFMDKLNAVLPSDDEEENQTSEQLEEEASTEEVEEELEEEDAPIEWIDEEVKG